MSVLLAACGGGGSSAPDSSATPPAGSGTPPVTTPVQPAAPSGTLWHNDFALDLLRGVQVSPLDGSAPTQITTSSDVDVAVWPDGKQFVVTAPDIPRRVTAVTVIERATGQTVYQGTVNGYLRDVAPSPADKRLARVRVGETTTSDFEEHVIDFSTMQSRRRVADDDWFAWMPDGRFMLISISTGNIRTGSLDSNVETPAGRLQVPADRITGQFEVSPTGTHFVMPLAVRGSATNATDLWIANIDGSGFEALTDHQLFAGAAWSPDGKYVAYTTDTGITCSGANCVGSCEQWYTPVTERKVKGLKGQPGSESFNVSNRSGGKNRLGCYVLAWTP